MSKRIAPRFSVRACVRVCVCVCERERERDSKSVNGMDDSKQKAFREPIQHPSGGSKSCEEKVIK